MATKGIHRKEETALPNSVRERYENEKKKKTQEKNLGGGGELISCNVFLHLRLCEDNFTSKF